MNSAWWHAAGFGETDAISRAALQAQACERARAVMGRWPEWAWWVPGRVEWVGKHTDYAGGDSLVSALPRGAIVVASLRADRRIVVTDLHDLQQVMVSSEAGTACDVTVHQSAGTWATYVRAVVGRLTANFPGDECGVDIAFLSDLPRAAGLSSSSMLIVGLAHALIAARHLRAHPAWSAALDTSAGLAWYLGCVENGSAWGSLAGETGVGTHGGSEDHVALLTAQPGCASHYSYVPVRHRGDVRIPAEWTLLVATSGVCAEKTGAAQARYNNAADAVHRMLEGWRSVTGASATSLIDALSMPDADAVMRQWASTQADAEWLERRLTHLQREHARVTEVASAVRAGDVETLSLLVRASQDEGVRLLGNQIPETVDLVRLAHDAGALAASAFGAGFGGSVWALVPTAEATRVIADWRAAYVRAWPEHAAACEVFAAPPGPGVRVVGV